MRSFCQNVFFATSAASNLERCGRRHLRGSKRCAPGRPICARREKGEGRGLPARQGSGEEAHAWMDGRAHARVVQLNFANLTSPRG